MGEWVGAVHIEREKEPPTPNDFKLFCWMTDFISDRSGGGEVEGGVAL